ncbi:MAG: rhodanese-like domain-containing protein [Dehalococcoidia bacterium]|nr:rhodanese-like domain-containing protein [Dehalococcoidia bacterium]MSQ35376.1 rhodanese-like domain-containing protein [Dehalococcoidia bacterium]
MSRQVPGEPYTRISAKEALDMLNKGGATAVDVRREDEYKAGHIKGAMWVPVDDIIPRFDELPKKGTILFICAVGARSGLACEYAAAMGADTALLFNIEEGTPSWIQQGLPTSYGADR